MSMTAALTKVQNSTQSSNAYDTSCLSTAGDSIRQLDAIHSEIQQLDLAMQKLKEQHTLLASLLQSLEN
jgi:hypothetical protein